MKSGLDNEGEPGYNEIFKSRFPRNLQVMLFDKICIDINVFEQKRTKQAGAELCKAQNNLDQHCFSDRFWWVVKEFGTSQLFSGGDGGRV